MVYQHVANGDRPTLPPQLEQQAVGNWCEIMRACWHQDSELRPNFEQILAQLSELAWRCVVCSAVVSASVQCCYQCIRPVLLSVHICRAETHSFLSQTTRDRRWSTSNAPDSKQWKSLCGEVSSHDFESQLVAMQTPLLANSNKSIDRDLARERALARSRERGSSLASCHADHSKSMFDRISPRKSSLLEQNEMN